MNRSQSKSEQVMQKRLTTKMHNFLAYHGEKFANEQIKKLNVFLRRR